MMPQVLTRRCEGRQGTGPWQESGSLGQMVDIDVEICGRKIVLSCVYDRIEVGNLLEIYLFEQEPHADGMKLLSGFAASATDPEEPFVHIKGENEE